ncbi:MAG TPA: type I secretion system permease/ATPase [Desulfobulbus sp.]|nr:type I secretion system permease/ATPase [Desulfobulbus sp.]
MTAPRPAGDWTPGNDSDLLDDPLADCLETLTRLHGRPVSRTGLRAGLPLVDNRLTVEIFARAAERAGMASRVLKKRLDAISPLALPVILLLAGHRACILMDIDREDATCTLLLPETGMGESRMPLRELETIYSGHAIFVRPRFRLDRQERARPAASRGHWFWRPLFSSWRIYRDVLVASLLINLFGLASPFFTLNVYERVIPNSAFETLWVLATGVVVIYLFNLLMRVLRGYFIDKAGNKTNLLISATLFQKVLGLRMEARPQSVGAFARNLQQFESIRDFITSFSVTALIDMPFVCIGMVAIWYLGGSIVLIHISAVLLLALYALLIQGPLKKTIEKSFLASAQKNAILVEGLSGIETVKMLGVESQLQRAWEEAVGHIARWNARSRLFSASVSHFSNFIFNMTVVGVVIAGVYRITRGEMSQGGLIALVMLTRQAVAPMSQVISLAARFHQARMAMQTLSDIMALPVDRPDDRTFLHRSRCRGRIEMKNLSFAYPGQATEALRNINLVIEPGEKVAFIGPTGSGKTTLGKLVLGLYQPTGGMVCMDSTDIRQIDPADLRRFIGCVPQDIVLFRGTIRENIILGAPHVDDGTILRAAELSGTAEFVGRHAMGFDMPVGEQGRGLSGGQRQNVAMARAILHDPPILILDEPTSAMDNRGESRLKQRLQEILPDKTLILITHRASLLDLVDRIVVIDNGTIIADGPRDRVLSALRNGQIKT